MQLGDLQGDIARAMVEQGTTVCASLLVGGVDPAQRFAIHTRHYAASLGRALVERFAATAWLAGSALVTRAALDFVRAHPPSRPCVAEYGHEFPDYVAARREAARLPYLGQFARLDWDLGRLAIAVDRPPLGSFGSVAPAALSDARFILQPGLAYHALDWPLDTVMSIYLTETEPETFELRDERVWLELRGCRGELTMHRLGPASFVFRRSLADGMTVAQAARRAASEDDRLYLAQEIRNLLEGGLVVELLSASTSRAVTHA